MALTPDHAHLVVVDRDNKRLVVRDATDGRAVSTLTPAAGALPSPLSVVVVPDTGQLLVTDDNRNQAVLFGGLTDATVVRVFGEGQGSGDRQLNGPHGVALVSASDVALVADPSAVAAAAAAQDPTLVAIADTHNHRVVLYRLADAGFVRHFGSYGDAPGQFRYPRVVASVLVVVTSSYPYSSCYRCWIPMPHEHNGCADRPRHEFSFLMPRTGMLSNSCVERSRRSHVILF